MIDFSSNGIQVRILKEGFILMNLFLRKFLRLKDKYTRRYVCNLIFPYKADYFNSYWDEIISLGYNCEVNARLEDVFCNHYKHFLFTSSYEYNRELFLKALEELGNFSNDDYTVLPNGLIQNNRYRIGFHSRYPKNELFNNDKSLTSAVPAAIEELKSRVKYLAEKLENIFRQNKKVLFVIKLQYTDFNQDIEYIIKLNEVIKKKFSCSNPEYKLLVVISRKNYPNLDLLYNILPDNVDIGVVNAFAPDSNTASGGDIIGWKRLLKKYIEYKF